LQDAVPKGMTYSKFIGTYRDTAPVIKDYDMNSRLENTDVNIRRDEMIRAIMPYLPKQFVSITAYSDPAELAERTALLADIDKYVRTFMSNSIINGIDDASWKKHLDNLKKLKTDRYVDLLQSYYNKNKLESGIKFPTK
jgi:putative aldouronate transport system substrate-binding protein